MEQCLQSSRQYVTLEHGTPLFRVRVGSSHLVFTSLHGFGISYLTSHLFIAVIILSAAHLMSSTAKSFTVPLCVQEKLSSATMQPRSLSHHKIIIPLSRVDDVGIIMAHLRSKSFLVDSSSLSEKET